MYLLIMLFTIGYSVFMLIRGDLEGQDILFMLGVPPIFILFLFLFDQFRFYVFRRNKPQNPKVTFFEDISLAMRTSKLFTVEDFRKLQSDKYFQETLKQAQYKLEMNQIDETYCNRLEKKYDKKTVEGKAMEIVLHYLQEKTNQDLKV